ncbi:MAG: zinc dependent phospholipase C family protein [Bacillota bacterium]
MRIIVLLLLVAILCAPITVSAFKPAAHYALMYWLAANLPDGTIKTALNTHPDIAAWGANGPDLGYGTLGSIVGYAPWADMYHYERVGTMAAEQLKYALSTGDLKQIAFAAGWVTHVAGDLACHGIFVNPECDVYMDNETGRTLHAQLEEAAEKYIWYDITGWDLAYHSSGLFDDYFASNDNVPKTQMIEGSKKTHGYAPSSSTIDGWLNLIRTALQSGVGYNYMDYNTSINILNQGNRIQRLKDAFWSAYYHSWYLLTDAEKGDYSRFKNTWNLDAADDGRPIGTLTVNIKTANLNYAGTDNNIYFGMQLKDGTYREWPLDKEGYNDFEKNDIEDYFLFCGDMNFYPSKINYVWIRTEAWNGIDDDWNLQNVVVKINGVTKLNRAVNQWLSEDGNYYWSTSVSGW